MDITPEMLAQMHEDAQKAQQEETDRREQARIQLAEQFASLEKDEEVVSLSTKSVVKHLEDIEKQLRSLLQVDRDEDRKSYVSTQILRWIGKQIKEEEKRLSLVDRL